MGSRSFATRSCRRSDAAVLEWLAAERPSWPRWLNAHVLTDATLELRHATWAAQPCPRAGRRSTRRPRPAHGMQALGLAAWTVRDLETYRRLADLGGVAICAEDAALDG